MTLRPNSENEGRGFSRSRAVRWVACAFFLFHLAAITFANIPKSTALGGSLHAPFAAYTRCFSLRQEWSMFTSRPNKLSMDLRIISHWKNGTTTEHGALLPGILNYQGELRHFLFFQKLTLGSGRSYAATRYHRAMCQALTKETGEHPEAIRLVLPMQILNEAAFVQRTGRMSHALVKKGPRYQCP